MIIVQNVVTQKVIEPVLNPLCFANAIFDFVAVGRLAFALIRVDGFVFPIAQATGTILMLNGAVFRCCQSGCRLTQLVAPG